MWGDPERAVVGLAAAKDCTAAELAQGLNMQRSILTLLQAGAVEGCRQV